MIWMAKTQHQKIPKKRNNAGIMIVSVAVTLLCVALLVGSFNLRNKIDEYDAVAKSLQKQIEEQKLESQELERESKYIKTEEYIEQIARDRLGLVKKNEIIFKIEDN